MCLAIPGRIVEVAGEEPAFRTGRVSFEGVMKEVSLACLPEAKVGDTVLVHVGMALSIVDPAEAAEVFTFLREIHELAELPPPVSPP